MGIDKKSATHICNVIRRQIQASFPDFTPHMVLYENNDFPASLEQELRRIVRHPAGKTAINHIKSDMQELNGNNISQFIGLIDHNRNGFFKIFGRHNILALFSVNLDKIEGEFALKSQIYHLIWHALAIRESYLHKLVYSEKNSKKPNFSSEEIFDNLGPFIIPKQNADIAFQQNLMADVFAGSIQFLDGDPEAIRKLSAIRMKETLYANTGYFGERYPFAVCFETAEFMFENYKFIKNKKSATIKQAYKIAKDLGTSYNIPAIRHWKNFSQPAQHMAWIGVPPEEILGAALYTSENPYVRSIGELVIEHTGIEPEIITNLENFNPFTGLERAKNMHKKICLEEFRKMILEASVRSDTKIFFQEAKKQFQRLQTGNPYGFSAPACLKFADIYREEFSGRYDMTQKSRVETLFLEILSEIPFEILLKLSFLIFQKRRIGDQVTHEDILKICKQNPEFKLIGEALAKDYNTATGVFQSAH